VADNIVNYLGKLAFTQFERLWQPGATEAAEA